MCNFFSFVGDGFGNFRYFDYAIRKRIIKGKLRLELDSHTSILEYYKVPKDKHDKWSKYEYQPLTKEMKIDEGVEGHDHAAAENWVKALDFKGVVPELIIKPIVHPFKIKPPAIEKKHLVLLKEWASVWDSVWASVSDSVWASVSDSVRDSVRASVSDSVWDSVRDSVRASVSDSVWDSVRGSIWDSVWASVVAYYGSFFHIKYKVNITPSNKLWEMGIVPSFGGAKWRLHGGEKAAILWEGTVEDLDKAIGSKP